MPNWKRNNWKTAAGKDVINKEELLILEKNANILNDVQYVSSFTRNIYFHIKNG